MTKVSLPSTARWAILLGLAGLIVALVLVPTLARAQTGGTGTILREYWNNITGTAVTNLTSNANYPNNPSGSQQLTSLEGPTNAADNYGSRIRGYVHPPTTGAYTFWLASDDSGELWLSTSDNPANATRIAYVDGWTNSREWTKFASQQSVAITLTAGQKYYIEVLQKEGSGGDNVAVAWQGPGLSQAVIAGSYLSPFGSQPSDTVSINAGGPATGSFTADQYFSGGSTYTNTRTIDVSQITTNPPLAAVFNTERYGAMTYTIPNRSGAQTVTLYFSETYVTAAGQRLFNVSINGAAVLSNFDIFASAGGADRAIARTFNTTANSSGQVVIQFTAVTENPKINGISVAGGGGGNPTLTVSKGGTGTGTVTSSPSGINCGSACSATYPTGTSVTLTATPTGTNTFGGWSGACSGTSTTCAVTMAASQSVTASFNSTQTNSKIMGVNWADQRDNFVNGVLYVSGLSSSDNYSSAATVASRVISQLYSITGANTVRIPINEPTVSSYWPTYTGAIDTALGQGRVILAYWAVSGGRPANTSAFYAMWDKVVAQYGSNPNAYFEVINEPHGYSATDLTNMYNDWLNRYSSVPRSRVILDGAGLAQDVPSVGRDSRLNGTLLAVHDYTMFASLESETEWANHISSYIGEYASRTVCTEWGGPMGPGSKDGVSYDTLDYSIPSGSFFADYIRGVSSQLRTLGMGSVYWPGLRDGDWYSLTRKTGTGSGITLSLVNASGLSRIQYAWGIGNGGGTYVQIRSAATGLYLDGMGATANGSNAGQSTTTGSSNSQWVIENYGNYVLIRNRATGLYLDGMGRTTDGSNVGQWSASASNAQQWSVITDANNVLIRNRATGLYLDGMGRTTNGSIAGQYSSSTSANQRWRIVAAP